ncbi:hypothetical protein D9M71_575060 [compost metagenome]
MICGSRVARPMLPVIFRRALANSSSTLAVPPMMPRKSRSATSMVTSGALCRPAPVWLLSPTSDQKARSWPKTNWNTPSMPTAWALSNSLLRML